MMRRRKWHVWPLIALACAAGCADAAQVLGVTVMRDGGRFLIEMRIRIAAPPAAVFRALEDYAAMPRYNPDLRAVRVEPTGVSGRVRLFSTVHLCVLVFCKTLHQEEIMTATTNAQGGRLEARLLAHGGSFKGGRGLWTVGTCPGALAAASCLKVQIELIPAFWVPPIIGPWVIRRQMEEEARRTSVGLEQMALR